MCFRKGFHVSSRKGTAMVEQDGKGIFVHFRIYIYIYIDTVVFNMRRGDNPKTSAFRGIVYRSFSYLVTLHT